jgi:hypothetical protein
MGVSQLLRDNGAGAEVDLVGRLTAEREVGHHGVVRVLPVGMREKAMSYGVTTTSTRGRSHGPAHEPQPQTPT